jgi:predicted lipoprotein
MNNILNNKMVWLVVFLTAFNIGTYLCVGVLVDKTTDNVIKKLENEYSPSPYGPGINPDKVSPDVWRKEVMFKEGQAINIADIENQRTAWRTAWERNQGFSR